MREVNKKFSCRYYLNLVLVDEEERRYFKQQVTILMIIIIYLLFLRRLYCIEKVMQRVLGKQLLRNRLLINSLLFTVLSCCFVCFKNLLLLKLINNYLMTVPRHCYCACSGYSGCG